ncbi:MAG: hypothetical protein K0Q54_347 [Methylobacterium brachiatum]|jgi:hypothetical protein|nr:hypothetical protein [Methylobacterium brachiatum]
MTPLSETGSTMARWIPGAAVFGLLCLMIIPAPGIWGVLIGAVCVLAIIGSLSLLLLDRVATGILAWRARRQSKRRSRVRGRVVHAGSGMSRKL